LEGEFPRIQFENLLQAIQKSKLLERFQIGAIVTQQQLQTLSQSIPTMRIRELDVQFDGQILREPVNPRQNLLRAIRNNFSLRSVKGQMQNDELFGTPEDKQRLAFYISRNESLDRWVNNPQMVDRWLTTEKCGPTHWVWRKERDQTLCFVDCVRYWSAIT